MLLMKVRWVALAVPICWVWAVSACAMDSLSKPAPAHRVMPATEQPARVSGEYLVTLRATAERGEHTIRNTYSDFGIVRLTVIGERQYLLKLEKDPGLSAMKQKAERISSIDTVQPNFTYRQQ